MSDISASDAGVEAVEAPVEAPETEAFDLDAAVDDFATNAPDDWKGKASKIQSELKGLRGSRNELRERYAAFDGLHEDDFGAVTALVTALKEGNTEAAAKWMREAADGLSPAQVEAIEEAIEEAEATEPELSVAEQIEKALADRDKAHKEAAEAAERQNSINATFAELGYNTERNDAGHLVDFQARMVAQLAIDAGNGDIKAAHEAFQKMQADWATAYLKKHSEDQTLSPEGGSATTAPDPDTKGMTPAQKAQARIQAELGGPQA